MLTLENMLVMTVLDGNIDKNECRRILVLMKVKTRYFVVSREKISNYFLNYSFAVPEEVKLMKVVLNRKFP